MRPEGLLLLLDYRGALPLLNITTQQQHCSGLLECRYFLQEEINRTGRRLSDAGKAPGAVALIDPLFTTQSTVDGKAEHILLLHKGSTIWLLSSPGSSSGMGESVKAGGLPTHGSMPSSFTWVKGMGRRAWAGTGLGQVCICCPGIVTHTPAGRRGACSGEHSWWSSVSQSVCISKTGLSEGFGELGLTAKALML